MLRTLVLATFLIVTALPVTAGVKDGVAAHKRGNYRTAIREFKPLANQGDAKAQFNVGVMYIKGQGFPKNYRLAGKEGSSRCADEQRSDRRPPDQSCPWCRKF